MEVTVVQVGGVMFIGKLLMVSAKGPALINPRVIKIGGVTPNGDVQLQFQVLIGEPKEITLHNMLFSYDADESLERAYKTAVSEIEIVKTMPQQIIQMAPGGRGNN